MIPAGRQMREVEIKEEGGLFGFADQLHAGLVERPVALPGVAIPAGHHHILPACPTAPRFGNDMVDGHFRAHLTAVLTDKPVAFENVFLTESNTYDMRMLDIVKEPYNAG
jgi:hypothetical protein